MFIVDLLTPGSGSQHRVFLGSLHLAQQSEVLVLRQSWATVQARTAG